MLNPVQEYAKARSMPIPALVAVLQGQSDMVSLGVAHAALKEKTEAEIAKKGADAASMAQAPKVIDRDMAMAQGLAAMPSDVDVPMGGIVGQDGQMTDMAAGGGIVAFQAGGRPLMSTQRPGPGVTFSQAFPNAAPAAAPATRGFMDYVKGAGRGLSRFLPGFSMATATDNLNAGEEEQLEMYRTLLGLGYTEEDVRNMPAEMRKQIVNTVKQSQAQQTQQAPQVQPEGQGQQIQGQGQQIQGQGQQAPGGIAALPTRAAPDTSNLMTRATELLGQSRTIEGGVPSIQTAIQQEREGLTAAGFDFKLMENQVKDLRAEKEALKGSKKEAANLRLIEAGLGILGGESPYAFVNIGKGASPALKGLAEDLKGIRKEQRDYDKAIRDAQLAENQIAAGVGAGAMRRRDSAMERADRAAERLEANKVSMAQSLLNTDTQRYVAEIGRDTQRYVADTSRAVAQSQRADTVEATRRKDALDLARRQVQAAMQRDPRLGMDTAKQEELLNQYFTENYKRLSEGPATEQPPSGLPSQSAIRAEMARRGMK
jgi:hypothetical protein